MERTRRCALSDRPRWWKADAVYSEVKKCIDVMFFLKPTPEIRNIIGACLGRAQKKHPVKIFWVDANVNHLTEAVRRTRTVRST